MAEALRSTIGVDSVYYAVYNPSTGTYGAVTALPQVRDITFGREASTTYLYGDNGVVDSAETVGDQTISLEVTDMLRANIAAIYGHAYANGIIAEAGTDQSAVIALGCRMLKSGKDGANNVYEYAWYPRVRLQKPDSGAMTKEASVEFQTMTMEGAVMQNAAGVYRTRVRSDDASVAATTLTGWFTAVVESTGASATAVTVGTITGDDSDNIITIPFAKGGETFSMKTVSDYDITVSVVSTGVLLAGTSTYTYSAAGVAPTIIITNANIGAVAYLVTVSNRVRDSNNVPVTPLSQLVTPA